MSKTPLIGSMPEEVKGCSSLEEEPPFSEESEPLHNILKFRRSHKNNAYIKRQRWNTCTRALFAFFCGMICNMLLTTMYNEIVNRAKISDFNSRPSFALDEMVGVFRNLRDNHNLYPNLSEKLSNCTNYQQASILKQHFHDLGFQVSDIFSSKVLLGFKNRIHSDVAEIIVGEGEIRYRNERNATYTYRIPKDVDAKTNTTSGIMFHVTVGLPVYANFGTNEDFNYLMANNVTVNNYIVIIRLGKISILEKVKNAFTRGAIGVLLFADPQQFPHEDMFIVKKEIPPPLVRYFQNMRHAFEESKHEDVRTGIPVQIIEAMTAQNLLREMSAIENKSPESWHGSLDALYAVGPGFSEQKWSLRLYTSYINMDYEFHDVVAIMPGKIEPDHYVVIGNTRQSLKENYIESTTALIQITNVLKELSNKGWQPRRTVVFCSFGAEELSRYSLDSWMETHKDILKERAVAYLRVQQLTQGLEYFNIHGSSVLLDRFRELLKLIENPNVEEKNNGIMWLQNSNTTYVEEIVYDNNGNDDEHYIWRGVPSITFAYSSHAGMKRSANKESKNLKLYDYESTVIQAWSSLAFTLAEEEFLPFNVSRQLKSLRLFWYNHFKQYITDDTWLSDVIDNIAKRFANFRYQVDLKTSYDERTISSSNHKLIILERMLLCDENDNPFYSTTVNPFSEDNKINRTRDLVTADDMKTHVTKIEACLRQIDQFFMAPPAFPRATG